MNPHEDDERDSWRYPDIERIEGGVVTTVNEHVQGDNIAHEVWVRPDSYDGDLPTEIIVTAKGDTSIPMEGQRVLVGHRTDARPIVLGQRYEEGDDVPPFKEGERRVGHPASDSYVRLLADGSMVVNGHNGNKIELKADGTVVINEGTTQPVTDVSTTTDADGHVTSISLTRADGVSLPSN